MERVVLLALFSTFVNGRAGAQDKPVSVVEKFSARVQIQVDAEESLSDAIKSHLNRGLRSLGDVVITDSKPDYTIKVVALGEHARNGTVLGYALSVLITMPLDPLGLKLATALIVGAKDEKSSLDLQKNIEKQVKGYELVVSHTIRSGDSDSLPMLCKEVVTNFDAETLEDARKAHQEIYEKSHKKKP